MNALAFILRLVLKQRILVNTMVSTRRSGRTAEHDEDDVHAEGGLSASDSGSDSDDAPEEVSLATSRSRVQAQREAQRQAQQEAKNTKAAQREKREQARKERREQEAEERAAAARADEGEERDKREEVGVDDEDLLPDEVLHALASREQREDEIGEEDGEDGEDEEQDQRVLQRRIVSQQLRALSAKSNSKRKFGEGRSVGAGIVVKSLKGDLGSERARGASASRKFLESRLGRHARDHEQKKRGRIAASFGRTR